MLGAFNLCKKLVILNCFLNHPYYGIRKVDVMSGYVACILQLLSKKDVNEY